MSDPVTNVEIEDVLSSIRKLVSDGDKARTRDPASVEPAVPPQPDPAPEVASPAESKSDKLVLTPALMVVGDREERADQTGTAKRADDVTEDDAAEATDITANEDEPPLRDTETQPTPPSPAPLALTDPIIESPSSEGSHEAHNAAEEGVEAEGWPQAAAEEEMEVPESATRRSSLAAQIAELEAAVGGGSDEFEPDGSEFASHTIAWPEARSGHRDDIEDAEEVERSAPVDAETDEAHLRDMTDDTLEQVSPFTDHVAETAEEEAADAFEDDDLDTLIEAGGVTLDEEALRELVAEVVKEELTGPLGERITRNVRKLVRREIYRILSSQEFD